MTTVLEARSLAVAVGSREILTRVDFSLEAGRCLGIVGETGSGKTMTTRLLTGTLDRIGGRVVRGNAIFDGLDLATVEPRRWRSLRGRRIALVPQASLSSLDPVMTVGRQLTEAVRELRGSDQPRTIALELLDQVRMSRRAEVFSSYPHQLSGGMRQRVMIALALAGRPTLLVADEPTTALDVTIQRQILTLLADLQAETGMTLVLVTHDLGVIESIADAVAVMYAGTTVEFGPTGQVLSDPAHPYTRALLAALPTAAARHARLMDIPGHAPSPREWSVGCRFAPRCQHSDERCVGQLPPLATVGDRRKAACVRVGEI
jgi:oligopeptide/dipeptide ABC transporter ATP-binding protein